MSVVLRLRADNHAKSFLENKVRKLAFKIQSLLNQGHRVTLIGEEAVQTRTRTTMAKFTVVASL